MTARRPPVLLGRAAELELLERMLRNVHGGQSAVLVIRGEAGVGKTALVDRCAAQASAFRVARVAGVEAEMEFPFAAVHQLCARMLDRLDVLPEPQRDALSVALGLSPGPSPDRFLVALAVLSLLSATAEERPLLCVVDDAQWLDGASGQILGFVARRLLAESVALVFAVREPADTPELEGLPALPLAGLGEEDARALLASVPGRLDDEVRDRIIAEMRGNPLALLELPQRTLAGGFSLPAGTDLPDCLEQQYMERVRGLPAPTQRLLLLAAAEPAGDATLLWRAAEILGIGAGDAAPAEEEALVEGGMRFRHPLVRSAAYRTGSPEERRIVHAALAEASDPIRDADRRAWHRALAASEPDEEVAAELERSAGRAHVRGGFAAAATLLERAVELTPDPASRAQRALAAADTKLLSEDPDAALRLLAQAEAGPLTPLARAHGHQLRGRIAFGSRRGREAPPLLLAAARELEALDPELAWDTYLVALLAALLVGRMSDEAGIQVVAQAVRAASPPRPRPQDLLLQALAIAITDGQGAAAPLLKEAVGAFRTAEMPDAQALRLLGVAIYAAEALWDEEGMLELLRRCSALARQTGALRALPITLGFKVRLHLFSGELGAAASLVDEIAAIAAAIGRGLPPYSAVALAAFRGHEAEAAELIRRPRGSGRAWRRLRPDACRPRRGRPLQRARSLSGGVRSGTAGRSTSARARALDLVAARAHRVCRAQRSTRACRGCDGAARAERRRGRHRLGAGDRGPLSRAGQRRRRRRGALSGRARPPRAHASAGGARRAHLLYGEWLRRQARRVDAREQLRTARRMFTEMGMEAFAERARRELIATGETVRKRAPEFRDELTPQEEHIAQLARGGLTNAEIGGQLFLSPRTVEWHLKKVFGKLGISSRRGLHDALPT